MDKLGKKPAQKTTKIQGYIELTGDVLDSQQQRRVGYEHATQSPGVEIPQLQITPNNLNRALGGTNGGNQPQLSSKKGSAPRSASKAIEVSPTHSSGRRSLPRKAQRSQVIASPSNQIKPVVVGQLMQPRIISNNSGSLKMGAKKQTSIQVPMRCYKLKMAKAGAQGVFSLNSTKECTFCQQSSLPGMTHAQHSSCFFTSQNSSSARQRAVPSRELIMKNLGRKYGNCHIEFESMKVVNDLIYNEQTHMVSIFKDYLIWDDINEFLKRYYVHENESYVRLPKLCQFYEKYSQVFPNYIKLPESKYMFRNIQRKQHLIDEQFNRNEKKEAEADEGGKSKRQQRASMLLNSANRLFTTGFVDSVWNQKSCSALPEEDWSARRAEAQEQRYLESARRLGKMKEQNLRKESQTAAAIFQPENLEMLVQKFMSKDSDSTIRLNSSLGQVGDEILGSTFIRSHREGVEGDGLSYRMSSLTIEKDPHRTEIGLVDRQQSDMTAFEANRFSIISQTSIAPSGSFQKTINEQKTTIAEMSVTNEVSPSVTSKFPQPKQQLRQNLGQTKSNKPAGSFGNSTRLSSNGKAKQGQTQPNSLLPASLKQKFTATLAANSGNASAAQMQLGNRYLQAITSTTHLLGNSKQPVGHKSQKEEGRNYRDNYLDGDIIEQRSIKGKAASKVSRSIFSKGRKQAKEEADSNSHSPLKEGLTNPLSSQPLLSKTSMSKKKAQPGTSLEIIKQFQSTNQLPRPSDLCIGSASPTQHLYQSKKNSSSLKSTMTLHQMLPQLNMIQQQVESDYYQSAATLAVPGSKVQFLRSHTALNTIPGTGAAGMVPLVGNSAPLSMHQSKKMSRERSPPLMQSTQYSSKGRNKSPHKRKDKRAAASSASQYQTGKSSSSAATISRVSPKNLVGGEHNKISAAGSDSGRPLSTQGTLAAAVKNKQNYNLHKNLQQMYAQTEINEAAEDDDYPEEEVADEIPDPNPDDDTEDENDDCISDDEGHANQSATISMNERLRPRDMLVTHGGAFQDSNSSTNQYPLGPGGSAIQTIPRAQTQLAGGVLSTAGSQQSHYVPMLTNSSMGQFQRLGIASHSAVSSLLHFGSDVKSPTMPQSGPDRPVTTEFSCTQRVDGLRGARTGVKTELGLHPLDPTHISVGLLSPGKLQGPPLTSCHAANRPNMIFIGQQQQSLTIRSKFSRENSISSRQETYPGATKPQIMPDRQYLKSNLPENQRMIEASLKLGGKVFLGTASLKSSMHESVEPIVYGKQGTRNHQTKLQSVKVGLSQASSLQQSKSLKNSQMQNYKVDLTTRLTNNLINDQLGGKKKNHDVFNHMQIRNPVQKSGAKTANGGQSSHQMKMNASKQEFIVQSHKPSDVVQKSRLNSRLAPSKMSLVVSSVNVSSKRKTVTSQSPQTQAAQKKAKNKLKETLGFKAMGSGKASYLTNVGVPATGSQNTLSQTSRNLSSPYATANQNPRFIPKDASMVSIQPQSKAISRSPPLLTTAKNSVVFNSKAAAYLQSPDHNSSLQQQLQHINRQLTVGQVKTSSYRQKNAISPPHSSSQQSFTKKGILKGYTSSVLSPANSSPHHQPLYLNEKISGKSKVTLRKSQQDLGRGTLNDQSSKGSLQRQKQKIKSFVASQALISLPSGNQQKSQYDKQQANQAQQKNHNQQLGKAPVSKQFIRQQLGLTIELKLTGKTNAKGGNFLGQARQSNASKMQMASPPAEPASKAIKQSKKRSAVPSGTMKSDRSVKSDRGAAVTSNKSVSKFNFFQSTMNENARTSVSPQNEILTVNIMSGKNSNSPKDFYDYNAKQLNQVISRKSDS